MQSLKTFLSLVSKTQGRDKVLRLFQYLCIHALDYRDKNNNVDKDRGYARRRVYEQMRMTRKMLRFLRTLDFAYKVKKQATHLIKISNGKQSIWELIKSLTNCLQFLFNFLYYVADHYVCLSQLDVISKEYHKKYYPLSMKLYLFQNISGILHNIVCMISEIVQIKDVSRQPLPMHQKSSQISQQLPKVQNTSNQVKHMIRAIKYFSFDMIRCFLDCLIALYYWKGICSAKAIGIIGTLSTVMSVMQVMERDGLI